MQYFKKRVQGYYIAETFYPAAYEYLNNWGIRAKNLQEIHWEVEDSLKIRSYYAQLHHHRQSSAILFLHQAGEYAKFLHFQKMYNLMATSNQENLKKLNIF